MVKLCFKYDCRNVFNPKNVLDKAKKDVKKLSNLESMEGLKPFDEIEKDSDCNSKEDKSKDKK